MFFCVNVPTCVSVYVCTHIKALLCSECEVRGLKKPLKCYELYWLEVPQCIDYKPYETRQAEDLKLDCREILTGGILPFHFCSTFESLLCKCYFLLSVLRRCSFGTHAFWAEECKRTPCDIGEVKPHLKSGESTPTLNNVCVHFVSAELHVFSGPKVSDQPVHCHTAGTHHSLPRTGGSGKAAYMRVHPHKLHHRKVLDSLDVVVWFAVRGFNYSYDCSWSKSKDWHLWPF